MLAKAQAGGSTLQAAESDDAEPVDMSRVGESGYVVAFSLSSDIDNPFRVFSNYYQEMPAYEYEIKFGVKASCKILCPNAVKALHLTKASFFGDIENFDEILMEPKAHKCKVLGRKCKNFDEEKWQKVVQEIAYEVALQKFSSCEELRDILLSTGDSIIAEAVEDKMWGIGLDIDDPNVQNPEEWPGKNIQGKALMQARETLRERRKNDEAA